jgi:FkbM family methyltransferase
MNLPLFLERYRPGKGQIIVDVGAGIGTEVSAFSSLVGEEGRVVSIEADPVAYRRLSKAVRLADLKNVILINKAITDRGGQISLSQGPVSRSNSVMAKSDFGVIVESTTVDQLLDEIGIEQVDYLKMNIEGAEVLALEGFTSGPSRVRNWCISCHDFKRGSEFATFNRVRSWLDRDGLTVWPHEPNDARPWETYYLYARRD